MPDQKEPPEPPSIQVPAKAIPKEPKQLDSVDAAMLQSLGQVVVTAMEQWNETARHTADAEKDTARTNAEWREKEMRHEVDLAEINAKSANEDGDRFSRWKHRRENTIRLIGSAVVLGLIGFLFYALYLGKIADPVAAIPSLVVAFAFVYLLVKQVANDNPSP